MPNRFVAFGLGCVFIPIGTKMALRPASTVRAMRNCSSIFASVKTSPTSLIQGHRCICMI
jgi:hypothetical protein